VLTDPLVVWFCHRSEEMRLAVLWSRHQSEEMRLAVMWNRHQSEVMRLIVVWSRCRFGAMHRASSSAHLLRAKRRQLAIFQLTPSRLPPE
jgi:hypothetical protein